MRTRLRSALPALAVAGVVGVGASAAPAPVAWDHWRSHDETHKSTIDHTAGTAFLERYVVEGDDLIQRVRYERVSAKDRRALGAYIARLVLNSPGEIEMSRMLATG